MGARYGFALGPVLRVGAAVFLLAGFSALFFAAFFAAFLATFFAAIMNSPESYVLLGLTPELRGQ